MTPADIEEDKQRWFRCWRMLRTMSGANIREWLERQEPDYKADMARRLNTIRTNDKEREHGREKTKQRISGMG